MSKQLLSLTALLTATVVGQLAFSQAAATDLRIYSGFGEVRQAATVQNNQVSLNLPVNLFSTIVPDSLDLDGAQVGSRALVQQPNWLKSLEGKEVTLREAGPQAGSQGAVKTERVTLIRAKDLLIKDAAGLYRNVTPENLSYDVQPPENPYSPSWQATFNVVGAAGKPTLTYLTRALSWTPRYTLKLAGTTAALSALADIRNSSDQPFEVGASELYAGEVQIQSGPEAQADNADNKFRAEAQAAPVMTGGMGLAAIRQGESGGLYRYGLTQPFTLPANGNISLPFLNPKVSFSRYGVAQFGFSGQGGKGNLNRGYRLKSDTELPAGPVTVREDGRLVGQVAVPQTSANDPVELNLGADPDLSYTRAVAITVQGKGTKLQTTTFKVTYTLENAKNRPIRFEVTEYGLDARAVITGQASRGPDGNLVFKADVPAKTGTVSGKQSVTYTVVR
jgi:hypothetical protein